MKLKAFKKLEALFKAPQERSCSVRGCNEQALAGLKCRKHMSRLHNGRRIGRNVIRVRG